MCEIYFVVLYKKKYLSFRQQFCDNDLKLFLTQKTLEQLLVIRIGKRKNSEEGFNVVHACDALGVQKVGKSRRKPKLKKSRNLKEIFSHF